MLAIPNISRKQKREILNKVSKFNLSVRTLPSLGDIAKGKINTDDLISLEIDDLLGREKVKPDENLMMKNIKNKTVLVTGAGGSIGSQICREILKIKPKILLILDSNEYSLYSILNDLNLAPLTISSRIFTFAVEP